MDANMKKRNELLAKTVIKGLESRNMSGYYAQDKEAALKQALELIPNGSTIAMGGCMSAHEIGLVKALQDGDYNYIDRAKLEPREGLMAAYDADFFLSSANAVTDDGVLVNIDGNSNRVSCIAQGPKKVIFIVGINKVCPDLDSAMKRARNVAATANAQRFDIKTPCKETGKCFDCKSPDTICCQFLITRYSRHKDRIHVILVNDTLGLSLHPEFPIYSTKQKQVTFILHNNSGTDIGFGGYYSYTYEDEKGIWRDVPMQLVVFDEEIILWQGNKYYYNAELFRHTPGRYRFFLTVRRYSKEYTLMTEFQLQDNMIELFKRHPYSQLNDTLLPSEEEAVYPPIYNVIDQMPEFPGGIDKLLQFINDNMKYPTKAQTEGMQGKVIVQFIIDEDGYIIEPNIVRSVESSLDNEALRLIKMLPQWKPGTLKGKAVKVKYTVPVAFKLK